MIPKITPEHLQRGAVVYVRQSTLGQVVEHTESQRRQYALADSARTMGFITVDTIDEDLGRSSAGTTERPGFQRLVGSVCSGLVGAVFCLEASRLARNGRDWHHLIDLCALTNTLVVDGEGVYNPQHTNDRLLLGLKGTMSEYELSLLRQRGIAARDSKAKRGELRFALPAGYCWNELGRIEQDPDERVREAIQLVFRKFRELGSARQVFLWARRSGIELPVVQSSSRVVWRFAAYYTILELVQHPVYAGAYAFGRKGSRIQIIDGHAKKTTGHRKPLEQWNVLLHDHHPGYITWEEYEKNQRMISENAHARSSGDRKSGRGGRALLAGLVRCGRCGRMMRVVYGTSGAPSRSIQYRCEGDQQRSMRRCIGVGGVRVDRTVAGQLLEAVTPHAIDAAIEALEGAAQESDDVRRAVERELEDAKYEARLASRRYEAVDPEKRLVARELEARWNAALERVQKLEDRLARLNSETPSQPIIHRDSLLALARDLPAAWNAPTAQMRTKQRIVRILVNEVVLDLDEKADQIVITIHWMGGRHTELRVARARTGRYPRDRHPSAVEVIRKLGGQWSDRDLALTMNRMQCRATDGSSWTAARVRELRERLGVPAFDPKAPREECVSIDEAARRLSICVASVFVLIRSGALPARQLMASAPWQIPVAGLDSEAVKIGLQQIAARRPRNSSNLKDRLTLKLPGI